MSITSTVVLTLIPFFSAAFDSIRDAIGNAAPAALQTVTQSVDAQAAAQVEAAEVTEDLAAKAWVYVISPWGFRDLYSCSYGWNYLICSGTGLSFSVWVS